MEGEGLIPGVLAFNSEISERMVWDRPGPRGAAQGRRCRGKPAPRGPGLAQRSRREQIRPFERHRVHTASGRALERVIAGPTPPTVREPLPPPFPEIIMKETHRFLNTKVGKIMWAFQKPIYMFSKDISWGYTAPRLAARTAHSRHTLPVPRNSYDPTSPPPTRPQQLKRWVA